MPKRLRLAAMEERHRGLTAALAASNEEAASVCLSRHHEPPVNLTLLDLQQESIVEVNWKAPSKRVQDAWANRTDATACGACCCVLAGLEELRGLVAVRRAEALSGADYYVGPPGSGESDLEDCIRLEVAGRNLKSRKDLASELRTKLQQAAAGRSSLPAIAGVICFTSLYLVFGEMEEKD